MVDVKCCKCGKVFKVYKYRLKKTKNFYCSDCYKTERKVILASYIHLGQKAALQKIKENGLTQQQKYSLLLGRVRRKKKEKTPKQIEQHPKRKMRSAVGENNTNWKADNVSYRSLHKWVERWLGKPNICQLCKEKFEGRQIQWANISGTYKRDLSDWVRLCINCHKKFDMQRKF